MTAPLHAPLKAYGAAIAGIGLFSVMDMVIKVLVIDIGTYSTMVYRSICGAILASLVALVLRPGRPTGPALRQHRDEGRSHDASLAKQILKDVLR